MPMTGFAPELLEIAGLKCLVRAAETTKPSGLLVLLHGVGAQERSVLPLAEPVDASITVVAVRSRLSLGPGQYGWFPVQFTPQGPRIDAAAAETSRQALVAFLAQWQEQWDIAPQRTIIAGFSQGGILSASVALTAPERVGGFGILSGRILPEIEPLLAPPEALRHLAGWVAHGDQDTTLPVAWAERSHEWLSRLGVAHEQRRYPLPHTIGLAMRDDFARWVNQRVGIAS
jgi:phospholipase/carboxylesterase